MSEPTHPPAPALGLDFAFLARVYRTSLVLIVLLTAWIWSGLGRGAGLGFLFGSVLSLAGLRLTELSIRRFIRAGEESASRLLVVSLGKLFAIMALILGGFWAATQGWLNLLWVLPGFMLPHAVLLLKLVGRKVLRMVGSTRTQ